MSKTIYEAVPTHEQCTPNFVDVPHPKKELVQKWLYVYSLLGLALLVVFVYTVRKSLATRPNPLWVDCGGTPDEARRRGCHFDLLSFAWQVPECYDRENTEAFRTHDTWSYYQDSTGTKQRTEEDAMSGEHVIFVTAGYHFTHCTYMWRQLHRAYSIFGYVDDHVDDWNHTLHCQVVLLAGPSTQMAEINTIGKIRYPRCRRI